VTAPSDLCGVRRRSCYVLLGTRRHFSFPFSLMSARFAARLAPWTGPVTLHQSSRLLTSFALEPQAAILFSDQLAAFPSSLSLCRRSLQSWHNSCSLDFFFSLRRRRFESHSCSSSGHSNESDFPFPVHVAWPFWCSRFRWPLFQYRQMATNLRPRALSTTENALPFTLFFFHELRLPSSRVLPVFLPWISFFFF